MKVLHAVYGLPPTPPGGTEIYVASLCRALMARDVESIIVAPGEHEATSTWNDVATRIFEVPREFSLDELYGRSNRAVATRLARLLDEEQPDIVHQHALTAGCPSMLARQAKARGIPAVFTYHTPTVSCQRGSLMEHGRTECDGVMQVTRCGACTLEARGASTLASRALAHVPGQAGRVLAAANLEGGAWTALRMSSLLDQRHADVRELFDLVDRIVVLTPWVGEVLRRNGVAADKLVACPHGLTVLVQPRPAIREQREALRLVYFGRVDPVKGVDVLLAAFTQVRTANVTLDIYGVTQGGASAALIEEWRAAAGSDSRVRFLPPVPPQTVVERLTEYDILVVPSQWAETGPLVALEAFAAGIPVMGSNLRGLNEKITHDVDGLLVSPAHSVEAWREALERCAGDRDLVVRLAHGVRSPRSMAEVAAEIDALYADLCSQSRREAAAVLH